MTHRPEAPTRPSIPPSIHRPRTTPPVFAALMSAAPASTALAGLALAALAAGPAQAYIGPGAGLGVFGAIVALFGALVLLVVGFVWYPIKRLLGKSKAKAATPDESGPDGT